MPPTCCLFGQQERLPRRDWGVLQKRLEREILALYEQGVTTFAAGDWPDFGWIAAATVLKLKETRPGVYLWLVEPPGGKVAADRPDEKFMRQRMREQADRLVEAPPGNLTEETDWIDGCMEENGYCLCYVAETAAVTQWMETWREKGVTIVNFTK